MGSAITDYHQVKMAPNVCLSPHAGICGVVSLGAECSVFAGVQIRGDCEPIVIGAKTNIQENSCLHVSMGSKMVIGERVTVGHMVMLHGCTIEDNVLVGMGSTIMDDALIGHDSIVGAGSLVTQGKSFPPRSLIFGRPARLVRELTDEEIETMVTVAADAYHEVACAMVSDGLMFHPPSDACIWPAEG